MNIEAEWVEYDGSMSLPDTMVIEYKMESGYHGLVKAGQFGLPVGMPTADDSPTHYRIHSAFKDAPDEATHLLGRQGNTEFARFDDGLYWDVDLDATYCMVGDPDADHDDWKILATRKTAESPSSERPIDAQYWHSGNNNYVTGWYKNYGEDILFFDPNFPKKGWMVVDEMPDDVEPLDCYCFDRSQCFEPCGRLGHDAAHAVAVDLPSMLDDLKSLDVGEPVTAHNTVQAALNHMQDRAATYDKPTGERSMWATVEAFNAIAGTDLSEEDGWMFMALLKIVRSQQGAFKADNYEDLAAYAGLMAEAGSKERGGRA